MTVGPFSITARDDPLRPPSRSTAFGLAAGLAAGLDPVRRAALVVLKLMAQAAPATPPLTGSLLVASHAVLQALAVEGRPPGADLLADLRTLRIGTLLDEAAPADSLLACFRASPLFDVAHVEPGAPADPGDGWLIRAGQWADWCLTEADRTLFCRLGHACLAGDNAVVGRIAVDIGREILGDGDTAGPTTIPVDRLLAVVETASPYPGGGNRARALAMEGVRALARGRVIGRVVYPGPRGKELFIGSLLPRYPVNGR